ncbi:MAG: DUF6290 family protein [Candidatus Heimdallarchaeota archaeon]
MAKTSVISIRISDNTKKMLEKYAQILQLKVSVLAAKILEEKTEDWSKEYAERIYSELGLSKEENSS